MGKVVISAEAMNYINESLKEILEYLNKMVETNEKYFKKWKEEEKAAKTA